MFPLQYYGFYKFGNFPTGQQIHEANVQSLYIAYWHGNFKVNSKNPFPDKKH